MESATSPIFCTSEISPPDRSQQPSLELLCGSNGFGVRWTLQRSIKGGSVSEVGQRSGTAAWKLEGTEVGPQVCLCLNELFYF